MEVTARQLVGKPVEAGGEIVGKIDDVFFDVRTGGITHMSITLTGWNRGTIVLTSLDGGGVQYAGSSVVFRDKSAEDIRHASLLDEESAWNEDVGQVLARYQEVVPYWSLTGRPFVTATRSESVERKTGESALWGSRDLKNAPVSDGHGEQIGRVEDLVFESDTWKMTHVMLRQGHWYRPTRIPIEANRILEVGRSGEKTRLVVRPSTSCLVA